MRSALIVSNPDARAVTPVLWPETRAKSGKQLVHVTRITPAGDTEHRHFLVFLPD